MGSAMEREVTQEEMDKFSNRKAPWELILEELDGNEIEWVTTDSYWSTGMEVAGKAPLGTSKDELFRAIGCSSKYSCPLLKRYDKGDKYVMFVVSWATD